jgi:hypothetical protein
MPTTETFPWAQETNATQRWPQGVIPQPSGSTELKDEIERAKKLIDSAENWDEEQGLLYSQATLERASAFLRMHADHLLRLYHLQLPVPRIGVGPDKSIDLHWKRKSSELLVNIPADPNELVTFYGDDYGEQKFRGSVNLTTFNLGIAACLMN